MKLKEAKGQRRGRLICETGAMEGYLEDVSDEQPIGSVESPKSNKLYNINDVRIIRGKMSSLSFCQLWNCSLWGDGVLQWRCRRLCDVFTAF